MANDFPVHDSAAAAQSETYCGNLAYHADREEKIRTRLFARSNIMIDIGLDRI